jgi:hypothetical protein
MFGIFSKVKDIVTTKVDTITKIIKEEIQSVVEENKKYEEEARKEEEGTSN